MIFASPARSFTAPSPQKQARRPRPRSSVRLPIEKKVISEVQDREGQDAASRRCRASRTAWSARPSAACIFNDILTPKMAFYDLPLSQQAPEPHHRRLLPAARPARDDRPARPHEGDSASANRPAAGLSASPPTTCARRPTRRACSTRSREGSREGPEAVRARHHHRAASATTRSSTSGRMPATQITKQMMDDLQERPSRRRRTCRTSTRST